MYMKLVSVINMMMIKFELGRQAKQERGYTLLEYCAGAAVILSIIYVALNAMGQDLATFLRRVGQWALSRSNEIGS